MKIRIPARWAIALASLVATPALAATLVNGSFEPSSPSGGYLALPGGSAAIPGWTTTDSGVEWFQPALFGAGSASSGLYVVDIANYVYSAGGIQQTIATTPEETYTIEFQLGTHAASGRDGTCEVVATADGQSQTFSHSTTSGVISWRTCSFTFLADDASATVLIRCLQNANFHFAYVDGASLRDHATGLPPSTWGRIKRLYR